MVSPIRFAVPIVAGGLFWLSSSVAFSQPSQWCPPAGTVIKGRNTQGDYTSTAKGADPKDAALCISVPEGPGAGSNSGKTLHRLYGYYNFDDTSRHGDTAKNMRDGLAAILTGHVTEISIDMTNSKNGSNYVWSGTDSWKRMGQTTLTISGQPVNVISYRESFKGGANTSYDGYTDVWYDPVLHFFVKGEEHGAGGPIRYNWEVGSVTVP